ncbi:MAG TPA: phage tail tip lysozyme [Bradyrhizobium sp.]|nr:phage tail tip lysozyme [Bradyrhizobium sp.]
MPIDRDDFTQDCVDQAFRYGVDPHYLVALAQLLSGIDDNTVGDKIGPYRITQADWDAKSADPLFSTNFKPEHINRPALQCSFAAVMTVHAQNKLLETLDHFPSPIELYKEWPNVPVSVRAGKTADQALQEAWVDALDKTKDLIGPAEDAALAGMEGESLVGGVNLESIKPQARLDMAKLIVTSFAAAGHGKFQQAAAVGNAIAESNLNPGAHSAPPEVSIGLFQLNQKAGLGIGHSTVDLEDPVKNIAIIIAETKRPALPAFRGATTLEAAVTAFVRDIERPADQAGQIAKRLGIARKLIV